MTQVLWIGLGGAVGAMLRHGIAHWSNTSHSLVIGGISWPTGTLLVNMLGCLAAGLLMGWAFTRNMIDHHLLLIVTAGFLGAFTTFSAFAVDSLRLFDQAGLGVVIGYVVVQNLICLGVAFLGWWLMHSVV